MYVMKLEMAHESSGGVSGGGGARGDSPQTLPAPASPPHVPPPDRTFHHQILQLKKQQELQQQILLQHFQQQQQQLAEQHEAQLRRHLKAVQQWEQQKALEEAAAAREVRERRERERLELLRKKDKHDHSAVASTEVKQKLQVFLMKKQAAACANGTLAGSPYRNWGVVKSSSGESITSPVSNSHPYRLPPAPHAPPHLKYDSSDFPLRKTASEPNMLKVRLKARVFERRASPMARRSLTKRQPRRNCGESGSPRGSPTAASIREEDEGAFPAPHAPSQPQDLALFSSPSMPNISLGRPHAPAPPAPPPLALHLPPVSEAEPPRPLAAHTRRETRRLLGRTQSAPLPLGDPALAGSGHHYLRQQIRKTVLTRAHDAAQLREEEGEVIDLTDRRAKAEREEEERRAAAAAPLCRASSSPLVGSIRPPPPTTGLAYDPLMLKHACACGSHAPQHPEHGGRLQSVWARLCETGLAARCERTRPRKASLEELQSVHTEAHTLLFGTSALARQKLDAARLAALPARQFVRLACGGVGVDSDTTWNEVHTAGAARMAAGAVLELAVRCAQGELRNGLAVVRPPGHHAEPHQAMGFCFFNSVAVAARLLHTRLQLNRILIVDWDVHHGNGTQQIFYDDPNVLYISIHRHDDGNFFPGTGGPTECGSGAGLGLNVNIAWSGGLNPPLGDAEYMAAFRTIVMPIAKEYNPQMVLVSCGFDAAAGHPAPLGGYNVSPACFAYMTRELMQLANGKVVLALEGGYDLPAMCDCAQECVRALLGDSLASPARAELERAPASVAQDTLLKTIALQSQHWPCLKRYTSCVGLSALAAAPVLQAELRYGVLQSERDAADTVSAMASLSMRHLHHQSPESSRSVSEEPMEQDEGK